MSEMEFCADCGRAIIVCGHAVARLLDIERRRHAGEIEALLTHCLTTTHVPSSPCHQCWNYFPLINCEPCKQGNHVKCGLDECTCVCPPDQQPEDEASVDDSR